MRTDRNGGIGTGIRAIGAGGGPMRRAGAALAALALLCASVPAQAQLADTLSTSASYTLRRGVSGRPLPAQPSRDPYLQLIRASTPGAEPAAASALAVGLGRSARRSGVGRSMPVAAVGAGLSLATLGCSGLDASVATAWPRLSDGLDPASIGSRLAAATLPGSPALHTLSGSGALRGGMLGNSAAPCR
jgi:hypothetical protein